MANIIALQPYLLLAPKFIAFMIPYYGFFMSYMCKNY